MASPQLLIAVYVATLEAVIIAVVSTDGEALCATPFTFTTVTTLDPLVVASPESSEAVRGLPPRTIPLNVLPVPVPPLEIASVPVHPSVSACAVIEPVTFVSFVTELTAVEGRSPAAIDPLVRT